MLSFSVKLEKLFARYRIASAGFEPGTPGWEMPLAPMYALHLVKIVNSISVCGLQVDTIICNSGLDCPTLFY